MELPEDLKQLYKHWSYHTYNKPTLASLNSVNQLLWKEIIAFATERMAIWEKKQKGLSAPYTQDKILANYRFCNIYRELDKQTIQIHTLLKPVEDDFELWLLNLAFNRFLCKPETFDQVGFLNFDSTNNLQAMQKLIELHRPKYGTAYVFPISAIQKSNYNSREKFFTQYLPLVISEVAKVIMKFDRISVSEALKQILPVFGFNFKFHWTEILIDIAYQFPNKINLFKQFPLGPGSLPTIKVLSNSTPEETLLNLVKFKLPDFPYLQFEGKKVYLSAENWEGIGCEFRKYSNIKYGRGRRRRYK